MIFRENHKILFLRVHQVFYISPHGLFCEDLLQGTIEQNECLLTFTSTTAVFSPSITIRRARESL